MIGNAPKAVNFNPTWSRAHGAGALRHPPGRGSGGPPAVGQREHVPTGVALASQPSGRDAPCYVRLRLPTVFFVYLLPVIFASENSSSSVVAVISGATQ